jgi:glutamine amidotransferase
VITIVDYGMGNVGSIANMLRRLGAASTMGSTPEAVLAAGALILPGVGSFDAGMRALEQRGVVGPLHARAREGVPVLGLCLGMQLFAKRSEEGLADGLGWIDGRVVKFAFPQAERALKIPHMGWARLEPRRPHPIIEAIEADSRYYFAHSYYMECADPGDVVATAAYGVTFPAVVARGNVIGVQCHPEKSHRFGMEVLRAFTRMALD